MLEEERKAGESRRDGSAREKRKTRVTLRRKRKKSLDGKEDALLFNPGAGD